MTNVCGTLIYYPKDQLYNWIVRLQLLIRAFTKCR